MYPLVKQITLTQRQSLRFIYSLFSFSHEDNLVVFSTTEGTLGEGTLAGPS